MRLFIALVEMGLTTVEEMLREYFQYFAGSFFVQFVNCLGAFANSKFSHVRYEKNPRRNMEKIGPRQK